jgi:hypothetical protein
MSAAFMRNEPLTLSDIIPFSQTWEFLHSSQELKSSKFRL